jgi:hypothetical protein
MCISVEPSALFIVIFFIWVFFVLAWLLKKLRFNLDVVSLFTANFFERTLIFSPQSSMVCELENNFLFLFLCFFGDNARRFCEDESLLGFGELFEIQSNEDGVATLGYLFRFDVKISDVAKFVRSYIFGVVN